MYWMMSAARVLRFMGCEERGWHWSFETPMPSRHFAICVADGGDGMGSGSEGFAVIKRKRQVSCLPLGDISDFDARISFWGADFAIWNPCSMSPIRGQEVVPGFALEASMIDALVASRSEIKPDVPAEPCLDFSEVEF